MDVTFTTRNDGQIDAHLDDSWTVFDHALGDAISSLPPLGTSGPSPSTFWIDRAADGARRAATSADTRPFASGNVTYLRLDGDNVIAAYEFDPDETEAESMPLNDFLDLLTEWRRRVLAVSPDSNVGLPEIDQQSPIELGPGDDQM